MICTSIIKHNADKWNKWLCPAPFDFDDRFDPRPNDPLHNSDLHTHSSLLTNSRDLCCILFLKFIRNFLTITVHRYMEKSTKQD